MADSITWRRFCRLGLDRPVPHPTTLVKLVGRAGPEVVVALNAAPLGKLAAGKVLRARKLDVLLSASRVGPSGKAYGLDMTEEMLALARRNATAAGATNVEFLKGNIEAIPLPAETVDVVISNCVINLSVDKPAVFPETYRMLKPGGRLGVTDIVAEDHLTPEDRAARGEYVGCIAGALSRAEYLAGLEAAGFTDVEVTFTHSVGDGLHSAIVHATKPAADR